MQTRMLFHICCADCGLKLLDAARRELQLAEMDITLYFYNPNIHPESEHLARQKAVQTALGGSGMKLIVANWTPGDYFSAMNRRLADDPAFDMTAKHDRCPVCWEVRLSKTFTYAKDHGFTTVSSTLISSIYHDRERIVMIAEALSARYGIRMYIPASVDHCLKTSGFYKQNYEGCVFSLADRMAEKYGHPFMKQQRITKGS